jgi:hypothetical protein
MCKTLFWVLIKRKFFWYPNEKNPSFRRSRAVRYSLAMAPTRLLVRFPVVLIAVGLVSSILLKQ